MSEVKGSPFWTASVLLGKLFDTKSRASDEALVVLLYYYLGEANGGDQLEEIECRGNRMLLYLQKYRSAFPEIPQRHYSEEVILAADTVRENFKEVTSVIRERRSATECQSRP